MMPALHYGRSPPDYYHLFGGDAERFNATQKCIVRRKCCLNDVAIWDKDLETHWWRIVRYLDRMAWNGIILLPKKFEFCAREINFAEFVVAGCAATALRLRRPAHVRAR